MVREPEGESLPRLVPGETRRGNPRAIGGSGWPTKRPRRGVPFRSGRQPRGPTRRPLWPVGPRPSARAPITASNSAKGASMRNPAEGRTIPVTRARDRTPVKSDLPPADKASHASVAIQRVTISAQSRATINPRVSSLVRRKNPERITIQSGLLPPMTRSPALKNGPPPEAKFRAMRMWIKASSLGKRESTIPRPRERPQQAHEWRSHLY